MSAAADTDGSGFKSQGAYYRKLNSGSQEAMEEAPYARVEDVAEDLDDLWLEVDTLGERLEELTDSVSFLLLLEDRGLPDWPAD